MQVNTQMMKNAMRNKRIASESLIWLHQSLNLEDAEIDNYFVA